MGGIRMESVEFHPLGWEDREALTRAFREDGRRSCEYCFANNYLWNHIYRVEVAGYGDCMLLRYVSDGGRKNYVFPLGHGDKRAALEYLRGHVSRQETPLVLTGLMEEEVKLLEQWYPSEFTVSSDRDMADYVYRMEDLRDLRGKKYHGKRNHIARFKEHDWHYERLDSTNTRACQNMLQEWKKGKKDHWDSLAEQEFHVVERALCSFEPLELVGGVLYLGEQVVAFCLGEPLNEDTFVVHFEKAFADVQGAYPMINQQFVEHECQNYAYINREEDDGEEGLRRAKMSYRPVFFVEKYTAIWNSVL